VRVLIADDHTLVRQGFVALLAREPDIEVVAEAADGHEAVRLVAELLPDVAILDVGMPVLNGIAAAVRIRACAPQTRVLAISVHADGRYVRQMVDAGASGYLLKDVASGEMIQAIRQVAQGKRYFCQGLDYSECAAHTPVASLSPRELDVVRLVADGARTSEIATRLDVSIKTAEAHRRNAMRKLGVETVADLVRLALREGLVVDNDGPRGTTEPAAHT